MKFKEIFDEFVQQRNRLKVVFVGSCDPEGKPNTAPKMLIDVIEPNVVFVLDYRSTNTHANVSKNPRISLAFMDEQTFTGFRLTGTCEIVDSGKDFELAKEVWHKRLISYETDRMLERIRGGFSARHAENVLPENFVVIKLSAKEAARVEPDRILRALQ